MQNHYNDAALGTSPKISCKMESVYAGFWARAAAYLIDSVFVFVVLLAVRLVLSAAMRMASGTPLGGNLIFQYDFKDIVLYVLKVLYFVLFTYFSGATLGKRAMNLEVTCADPGEELSFFTVVYRETVGRFLCSVVAGIGYLMVGVDKEKRGLHDILCDTRVVYAKKIKVYETQVVMPIQVPTYQASRGETPANAEAEQNQEEETPGTQENSGQKTAMPWDSPFE